MEISEKLIEVVIIGTIVFVGMLIFIIIVIVLFGKRKYQHQLEKNQIQAAYQQILLQTQIEIQEQTLKNISQEIHDNIGQALSLAKLNLNMIDPNVEEDRDTKIQSAKLLVGKAIQDLRDISRSFNTDNINALGLDAALDLEFEIMRKTGRYTISVSQEGTAQRLPGQHSLIIFRIIQEVLQNIIKHSEAQRIDAELRYSPVHLRVKVRDDGKGFNPPIKPDEEPGFGLGIRNMNSRASLIGGSVQIESQPGQGTVVTIDVPIAPANI